MIRIINKSFIVAFGFLMLGCSTYIENEASLVFEPTHPAAHVTPDGEAPTGGIFKTNGNGLFVSDIRARDVGGISQLYRTNSSQQQRRRQPLQRK